MMPRNNNGIFTISLDFELYWGVRDQLSLEGFKGNVLGARTAIPKMLDLFSKYEIHATWAVVGFLFFNNKNELLSFVPEITPSYYNKRLSPYDHLNKIGENEVEDPVHFAGSLVKKIKSTPFQEIGTHTFSHYYCTEGGQDLQSFSHDLDAAIKTGKQFNINIESIVFPRNQINNDYLEVCSRMGIKSYRGNRGEWLYSKPNSGKIYFLERIFRLLDAYFNLYGHGTFELCNSGKNTDPVNIQLSRSLRPYSKLGNRFEKRRLKRILSDLTHAAENGLVYHLAWHPHNFAYNTKENLKFLEEVFVHYLYLKKNFDMESLNMIEIEKKMPFRSCSIKGNMTA